MAKMLVPGLNNNKETKIMIMKMITIDNKSLMYVW